MQLDTHTTTTVETPDLENETSIPTDRSILLEEINSAVEESHSELEARLGISNITTELDPNGRGYIETESGQTIPFKVDPSLIAIPTGEASPGFVPLTEVDRMLETLDNNINLDNVSKIELNQDGVSVTTLEGEVIELEGQLEPLW